MARFLQEFGDNVRSLRRQRGLSQEDLAARAGLHKNYISGIERARHNVSLQIACRIAEILGVSVASLIRKDGAGVAETTSEQLKLRRQIEERLKGQSVAKLATTLEIVKILTKPRS